MPSWYNLIKDTVQDLREHFTQCTRITQKDIGQWLLADIPRPRAEREWVRVMDPAPEFSKTWINIWKSISDNKTKDVIWKATHRVLTTRAYIASWGMAVSTRCTFCRRREDAEHVLLRCHRAQRLWDMVGNLLNDINGKHFDISMETLLFGNMDNGLPRCVLTSYLLFLGAHTLWSTRNQHVVDNRRIVDPINQLKNELRCRIRHDEHYHRTKILTLWTYKNVLCKYDSETLTFAF